jgi:hypothetical protein
MTTASDQALPTFPVVQLKAAKKNNRGESAEKLRYYKPRRIGLDESRQTCL